MNNLREVQCRSRIDTFETNATYRVAEYRVELQIFQSLNALNQML